ncbi:hypothetical protein [Ottowia thiooxydans]|uniref:Uncharacterized protein n=1 Tax=Ottowia thiooxydans TaxID=219182 RepID=A0ABV2QDF0_9BURK
MKSLDAVRVTASSCTPIARKKEISFELMQLVGAVREAEELFDALDNHTDPVRREFVELLTRMRKSENHEFRNTLPPRYHRPRLQLTREELQALAMLRDDLYKSIAAKKVRHIVHAARLRYPTDDTARPSTQLIHLVLAEDEMIDLADCWTSLPVDFSDTLQKVGDIREAATYRQLIQSGVAMVRAVKALTFDARHASLKLRQHTRFSPKELGWAKDCAQRLHACDSAQLADAIFQNAWKSYNEGLPSQHPFGLLLSESDLRSLTKWRDEFMTKFESDLHQLRILCNTPMPEMQVIKPIPRLPGSPLVCTLRFDGTQTTTTVALGGLQFWGEFSLDNYHLPLPFNVIVK